MKLLDQITFYAAIILVLLVFLKLFLFVQSKSSRKMGFIKTFFVFFSVHDLHNASSIKTKRFRRGNNLINYFFWILIVILIVCYVFNTSIQLDNSGPLKPARPSRK